MNYIQKQIKDVLADFIKTDEVQKLISECDTDQTFYSLLNPQIKVAVYIGSEKEIIASASSNSENGYREFRKKYDLNKSNPYIGF